MPENIFTPLSELTGEDLANDFQKLKAGDLIFRCGFEQLAKHFLSYHLPIKTFAVDFKILHGEYLMATNKQRETTSALIAGLILIFYLAVTFEARLSNTSPHFNAGFPFQSLTGNAMTFKIGLLSQSHNP